MSNISIGCCETPKYCKDVSILIVSLEIKNRCFFRKKGLSVSVCPSDSGIMEKTFAQRMYKKNDSFSAVDIPVNPVNNDFMSPFTLKRRKSIKGNAIIALNKDCWCNSIQIVTQKGVVLSDLEIKKDDVVEIPFIIEC